VLLYHSDSVPPLITYLPPFAAILICTHGNSCTVLIRHGLSFPLLPSSYSRQNYAIFAGGFIGIELGFFMVGITTFHLSLAVYQSLLHGAGLAVLAGLIEQSASSTSIATVFFIFSVVPFVLECLFAAYMIRNHLTGFR